MYDIKFRLGSALRLQFTKQNDRCFRVSILRIESHDFQKLRSFKRREEDNFLRARMFATRTRVRTFVRAAREARQDRTRVACLSMHAITPLGPSLLPCYHVLLAKLTCVSLFLSLSLLSSLPLENARVGSLTRS